MPHLNTKGTLTVGDDIFEGRIVTHHGRLRVFKVKDTIFDQQVEAGPDRLSKKLWSVTFEGGLVGQIQGVGCGCGGGR